ncbi:hypothetical protein [Duganella vulcania]|uniref:Uncharacterized protein n=1 Tax=Duganella vulcania TaxID=2692166 RepID=A0A845GI51_9BURK|nr:hypothetical protein [Duganella vulcania]MYM92349.1 hypothetical protein [Duganella vulcania]
MAFLEFLAWIFLMPVVCICLAVNESLRELFRNFEPLSYLTGLWMCVGGLVLWPFAEPDNAPYQNVVQALARASIWGLDVAQWFVVVGPVLLIVSGMIRLVQRRNTLGG